MRSLGYRVEALASAQEFLGSRHVCRTACLIADMQMPGMTGLELYQRLSTSGKPIPTILITAYPDDGVRERALSAGVIGYLSKPFEEDDMLACIRSALTFRDDDELQEVKHGNERQFRAMCRGQSRPAPSYLRFLQRPRRGA